MRLRDRASLWEQFGYLVVVFAILIYAIVFLASVPDELDISRIIKHVSQRQWFTVCGTVHHPLELRTVFRNVNGSTDFSCWKMRPYRR
jgi:hypothetical protein